MLENSVIINPGLQRDRDRRNRLGVLAEPESKMMTSNKLQLLPGKSVGKGGWRGVHIHDLRSRALA
jgi:hypothetical protein